jgi:hypothetical protein
VSDRAANYIQVERESCTAFSGLTGLTDKLDGNYWGPGRPARPGNGGEIVIGGPARSDSFGRKIADGNVVLPKPGGSVSPAPLPVNPNPRAR